MPNNIMLRFPTIFCKGCTEAGIETLEYEGTDKDGYSVKITEVQCPHENACSRIINLTNRAAIKSYKKQINESGE